MLLSDRQCQMGWMPNWAPSWPAAGISSRTRYYITHSHSPGALPVADNICTNQRPKFDHCVHVLAKLRAMTPARRIRCSVPLAWTPLPIKFSLTPLLYQGFCPHMPSFSLPRTHQHALCCAAPLSCGFALSAPRHSLHAFALPRNQLQKRLHLAEVRRKAETCALPRVMMHVLATDNKQR